MMRDGRRVGRRAVLAAGGVALLAAACGGPAPTAVPTIAVKPGAVGAAPNKVGWTPVIPSSDLAVGPNRFLYAVLDERNRPIVDATITMRFFELARGDALPSLEADAVFRGQGLGAKGVYVARVAFAAAGDWGVEAQVGRPDGTSRTLRTRFSVEPQAKTPAIGSPALATRQALMKDAKDPHVICTAVPPCSFHEITIADALDQKTAIVLLFATPGYCTSAVCGPDLETVQSLEPDFRGKAIFIHHEIYQNPNTQTALPGVLDWKLPSEPWVFLIDRDGKIADKLEGGVTRDELKEGIGRLV